MAAPPGDGLIPVRMLTQFAYCSRLGYLEWVQGEFESSADVEEGRFQHRVVDEPSGRRKMAEEDDGGEVIHARSVTLSDERLGLVAKADLLEIDGKAATPVEYKRGTVPDVPGNVYDSTLVQVCAQGLLLRANGYECGEGVVYYAGSKRRVRVVLDDVAVAKTLQCIHDMREMLKEGTIPPPLVDSPKCPRCSLVGICLPDETNALSGGDSGGTVRADSVRRMYPVRVDTVPVYVQEQGAKVSVSGELLVVKPREGPVRKVRLMDVSDLTLYGNVQVTTQAVRRLCERGIPVCYLSYGGRYIGRTTGRMSRNIDLRIRQHRMYHDKVGLMRIARSMVSGKIKNCMVMLRRNHISPPGEVLEEMGGLAERCGTVRKYDALLGMEGLAARLYFSEFAGMIKADDGGGFDFRERNRRPPKDPVNAMLSFVYMMLARQAEITVGTVGMDPYLGFLHTPHHGRPSLALDIMEEFRPIIGDSVCLTLVNTGAIRKSDFLVTPFGVSMTGDGRRKVITAFESRMDETIQHRLLGYSASYRRILETQARLLARHIMGEIPQYPPFRVR